MKDHDLEDTDPQSLTHMMDLGGDHQKLWSPEELGAILEHQLAAPLQCDLSGLDVHLARRLKQLNATSPPPLVSFGDLLSHPSPPLDLLELSKRFAKPCRSDQSGPLPDEVATALYFLSIVVALTRCGRRITKMDDRSLQFSLNWAIKQPWVGEPARRILKEGLDAIASSGPKPQ